MDTILRSEALTKDFYPPLSFSRLTKLDFKKPFPVRALEDLSFSLESGKTLAVLGPNGAGKTTLLKIIAGLILPDQGRVFVDGCLLAADEEKIKSRLGLITEEERSFYWRLTGRQNLEFFAALYGLDKKSAQTRIDALLELFEAADYSRKRFEAYSSGMKKRFALMRGMLHQPKLLLLDEPTKSLDFGSAYQLRRFIKEELVRKQGTSVVFTTHQMEEAEDFADLFLILDKGRMRAFGSLEGLKKKINDPAAHLGGIFLKLTEKAKDA